MGSGYYIVEISSNSESLFITAFNVECAESLVIQIDGEKSKDYLKKFDYDFEQIASCLKVRENPLRLVLLNPYFQTVPIQADFESLDQSYPDEVEVNTRNLPV